MDRPDENFLSRALLIGALAAINACASADAEYAPGPPPNNDAGMMMIDPLPPQEVTSIREDFSNFLLISNAVNIIHDVNQGLVRLPTIQFPEALGDSIRTYDYSAELNGVIAAEQILIMPEGSLRASDSVELIAADLVHVAGQIIAGPGGVTIAAGRAVTINGTVESEGPIRILLSDPTGHIEINGRVIGYSTGERDIPASIELLGRGVMVISGQVATKAGRTLKAGMITFDAYGDIQILGPANVSSTGDEDAISGNIKIRSETRVEISGGAVIGDRAAMNDPLTSVLGGSGDIEIQAPEVELGDDAVIAAASAIEGRGGSIMVTAGRTLRTGRLAYLSAGAGLLGGSIAVNAAAAELGDLTSMKGGIGLSSAGLLRIEASSALTLGANTQLLGGDGVCADGGSTTVFVAGALTLAGGSVISGGGGGISQRPCAIQGYRGGGVEVIAHRVEGDESGIRVGNGIYNAERRVTINPDHEVLPPNLKVAASGWVESIVLDRGEAAIGQVPTLRLLLVKDQPIGTHATLHLAGSATLDQPIDKWIVLDDEDSSNLAALRDARYFRYKLTLVGRVFDTPVVDFFEIDLAPARIRGE